MGLLDYFKGYPKCVFAILGNEFCERFSFYGMKAILVLFLNRALMYDDSTSTTIYHTFNMLCYFTPLLGAMIADGWLGKYKTILYISVMYALGNAVMAVGAIPFSDEYITFIPFIGLAMIALGTGGIKPCVSAFGADQFDDSMDRQKESFFSLFYMAINSGSLLSILITPILRSSVYCFDDNCWSLAFGVPAGLMFVAVILFIVGTKWYRRIPPGENIIAKLFGCIGKAMSGKFCGKGPKREHWLDYAEGSYSKDFIEDVKGVMRVLFMFIPLPMFWALFDQQGSRWTLQAGTMNGELGSIIIEPDMIQVINPMFILILVPVCESLLFPCMGKLKIPNGPMMRLGLGLFLAGLAFIASAVLQLQIDASQPAEVASGMIRYRVMNAAPCSEMDVTFLNSDEPSVTALKHLQASELRDASNAAGFMEFEVSFSGCRDSSVNPSGTFNVTTQSGAIYNVILGYHDDVQMSYFIQDQTVRTGKGESTMWIFNALREEVMVDIKSVSSRERVDREYGLLPTFSGDLSAGSGSGDGTGDAMGDMSAVVKKDTFPYDEWLIKLKYNDTQEKIVGTVDSRNGAVYTVLIAPSLTQGEDPQVAQITDIEKSDLSILWQAPQYFTMSLGEVLFSVTGLSFAYSQSPPSMKAVLQAGWLMTVAFGNLIVVIIAGVGTLPDQFWEFILFAGLMFVTVVVFAIMAQFYVFVDPDKWKSKPEDEKKKPLPELTQKEKLALDNKAFQNGLDENTYL